MAHGSFEPAAPAGSRGGVPDEVERLLWALMARFERLATERYAAHAPALATPDKARFVERLDTLAADAGTLAASALAAPVDVLLSRAQSADETSVLIVQGLVLEHLGQAIYRIAAAKDGASGTTRELAADGLAASSGVTAAASARIAQVIGTGDALYAVFVDRSHDVVAALDALADPVDEVFGERFGLRFADVMGEFVADLTTACTALGMQRRKVVGHLAGACMGI